MSILSLIIKREFIAKVRNKSFIVMTFLSPLLFVGMALLVAFLSTMNKDSVTQIAVHDEAGLLKKEFKSDKFTHYTDLSVMPLQTAKDTAMAIMEQQLSTEMITLYDPVPLRIVRVDNMCRAQLLIEATHRPAIQSLLRHWLVEINTLPESRKVRWQLEVDPLEI